MEPEACAVEKSPGSLPGNPFDEAGDVAAGDASAVFGGYYHGGGVGQDEFSAVAFVMVIDSCRYGVEQGGFAGVSASGHYCHSASESHSAHSGDFDFVLRRGYEWGRAFERASAAHFVGVVFGCLPREHRAVGDEREVSVFGQEFSDCPLFFTEDHGALDFFPVVSVDEFADGAGELFCQHGDRAFEFSLGELHENFETETDGRRGEFVFGEDADIYAGQVLIVAGRTDGEVRGVAGKDFSAGAVDDVVPGFAFCEGV